MSHQRQTRATTSQLCLPRKARTETPSDLFEGTETPSQYLAPFLVNLTCAGAYHRCPDDQTNCPQPHHLYYLGSPSGEEYLKTGTNGKDDSDEAEVMDQEEDEPEGHNPSDSQSSMDLGSQNDGAVLYSQGVEPQEPPSSPVIQGGLSQSDADGGCFPPEKAACRLSYIYFPLASIHQ